MNLMVIGEAARNIPEAVRQQYAMVDWRNIAGLRNIITHEYFRLNLDRVWNIVEVEIPKLAEQLRVIVAADGNSE